MEDEWSVSQSVTVTAALVVVAMGFFFISSPPLIPMSILNLLIMTHDRDQGMGGGYPRSNNVSCVIFHLKFELIIGPSGCGTMSKRMGIQTFRRGQ